MSELLDKFKELHYGLEVWQDATLLKNSLPEFNKLEEQIEQALTLQKLVKKRLINWDTEAERFLLQSLIEESEK